MCQDKVGALTGQLWTGAPTLAHEEPSVSPLSLQCVTGF